MTDVTDAHIFSADTEDGKNPAAAVGAAIAGGGVDKVRITASLKGSQGVSRVGGFLGDSIGFQRILLESYGVFKVPIFGRRLCSFKEFAFLTMREENFFYKGR